MNCDGPQRNDKQHGGQGRNNRREGDGGEPAEGIKRGADGSAYCKGGEHRHPDPGNDTSGVRGTREGKPPDDPTRDYEALRNAE